MLGLFLKGPGQWVSEPLLVRVSVTVERSHEEGQLGRATQRAASLIDLTHPKTGV